MPNKCSAVGCFSKYYSTDENISAFKFPFDKPELCQEWIKFASRKDWYPGDHDVLCIKHFEDRFIRRGKRNTLLWKLEPVPKIHSDEALIYPSTLYTPYLKRKAPFQRIFQPDELPVF